jgi:hypothetical protein
MHDSRNSDVAFSFGSSSIGRRFSCNLRKRSALPHTSPSEANNQNTLFPGLTNFRHTSPCHISNRDHGLQRELPITGLCQLRHSTVTADSRVVNCNRFSYQQVIHSLLHCEHQRCSTL